MSLRGGSEKYRQVSSKDSDDEDFKGRSGKSNVVRDYDVVCLCTVFTVVTIIFYIIMTILLSYILYDLEVVYKPLAQNATAEIKDGSGHLFAIENLMGDLTTIAEEAQANITTAITYINDVKGNQHAIADCIGCTIPHP